MEGISIRQKLILGCVVPLLALLALLALLVGASQAMSQLMTGMNAMYQGRWYSSRSSNRLPISTRSR